MDGAELTSSRYSFILESNNRSNPNKWKQALGREGQAEEEGK
jgi:hypothetical protein